MSISRSLAPPLLERQLTGVPQHRPVTRSVTQSPYPITTGSSTFTFTPVPIVSATTPILPPPLPALSPSATMITQQVLTRMGDEESVSLTTLPSTIKKVMEAVEIRTTAVNSGATKQAIVIGVLHSLVERSSLSMIEKELIAELIDLTVDGIIQCYVEISQGSTNLNKPPPKRIPPSVWQRLKLFVLSLFKK